MTTDTHGWIDTGTVALPASTFAFNDGFPSPDAASGLLDTRTLNRAIEVYLEQMPAVSVYAIRRGLRGFGATTAQHVVIWESRMDAATLLLTGNTETVYGMTFLDLQADGPTVVDVPAGMLGGFSDMWQRNVADIGKTGVDQGQGGKVLLLPPGSDVEVPTGYLSAQSPTFGVWLGLRGMLVDGKSDQVVSLFKQIRIYPLSAVDNPPPMTFLNGSGQTIDTIFPDTAQFFADLAQLVQEEPAAVLSSPERFSLASIGIVRGTAFTPDPDQEATLAAAARVGSAIARANTFASRDPERIVYPDRHWEWLFIGGSATWDAQGYVDVDRRAAFAYAAIGMSPAMANRVVGVGSQYIWTPRDGSGAFLDGGQTYRLHLPPDIPAGAFWSVVVYAAASRSMLQNGQTFPSDSQYTDPAINDDGSVDVWFGPQAPLGHERNWIKTVPGKGCGSPSSASTARYSRSSTSPGSRMTSCRRPEPHSWLALPRTMGHAAKGANRR
jgi:hypothetical protein